MSNMYDFSRKTILITGASSGLGEQFAKVFSKAGGRVILVARRIEKLNKLAKELKNAHAIKMDVSDHNSVISAFKVFEQDSIKIDVCINNAGIAKRTPIFEDDPKQNFEEQIQTNLMGVWYVTKAVACHMKNHDIHGSIINIASVNGAAIPANGATAYSISKAAVIHLTKTLVGELSPYKIRINSIAPGWFRTPMNGPDTNKIIPHVPLRYIAEPSGMDGLILYLASNDASAYVTGSCFTIDGGISWSGVRGD